MGQILKTVTWLHNEWLILGYNFSFFNQIEKSSISDICSMSSIKVKLSLKKLFLPPMNVDMNDLMLTSD